MAQIKFHWILIKLSRGLSQSEIHLSVSRWNIIWDGEWFLIVVDVMWCDRWLRRGKKTARDSRDDFIDFLSARSRTIGHWRCHCLRKKSTVRLFTMRLHEMVIRLFPLTIDSIQSFSHSSEHTTRRCPNVLRPDDMFVYRRKPFMQSFRVPWIPQNEMIPTFRSLNIQKLPNSRIESSLKKRSEWFIPSRPKLLSSSCSQKASQINPLPHFSVVNNEKSEKEGKKERWMKFLCKSAPKHHHMKSRNRQKSFFVRFPC